MKNIRKCIRTTVPEFNPYEQCSLTCAVLSAATAGESNFIEVQTKTLRRKLDHFKEIF